MGTLRITEFLTLDGVGQGPGAPDEDRDGGFRHGGWQAPLLDEEAGADMFERATGLDALLLGRKTYDIFAGYWPHASEDIPFTSLLNNASKYVASRTLTEPLSWAGTTLLTGDLADSVAAVKDRHDDVQVIGSLGLVPSLLEHGLVDQLDLWVYPLLLGSGKQLFGSGTIPAALQLAESTTYPNGTLHLVYDVAGVPTYGDMAEGEAELDRLRRP